MIMIGRDQNVQALIEEFRAVATVRAAEGWDKYWRECMRYALPQDVSYEQLLSTGSLSALTASMGMPGPSSNRDDTKRLYDQTSLWAIERLTAGLLSLKTPESGNWHALTADEPFGYEETLDDKIWFEKLTRYLFKVRANPVSGFWSSHKAAVRSVCALGDGYFFLEERFGDIRVPYTYEFVPLGECFAVVDDRGVLVKFFRHRKLSAEQIVRRWPNASAAIVKAAGDPKTRHQTFPILHAVVPRDDLARAMGIGVHAAPWRGVYIDMDGNQKLAEGGYWEMPYINHSWQRTGARAYSEGPMALALAEIKSLNEMAKNELISSQQAVRPPLAAYGENFTRVNLNAGAVNSGLVSPEGRLLVQPIMTHTRPDFAQAVLEQRRNNVKEMLYLNLWQILIQKPDITATEALIRAQEKGDLLGPVGISFNLSLANMVDREIGILARKGAFKPGSPLAPPEELANKNIAPFFTAPLDRMRNMEEVLGAQRTVAGMLEVAAIKPEIMNKLNTDSYAEILRRGSGGPASMFYTEEQMKASKEQQHTADNIANTLQLATMGGQAAQSIGQGAQALQQVAQQQQQPQVQPARGAA